MNATFRELLERYDSHQLWCRLSMFYNLPPIQSEHLFSAYDSARNELLSLTDIDESEGVLSATLITGDENNGIPFSRFSPVIVINDMPYSFIDNAQQL